MSYIMKIFEKLVNKNFMSYLEDNNILHKNQGGFRKQHSTVETVSTLVDFLAESRNSHKFSLAIFLDLSKAFDSVNHLIFISKLKDIGVKGNLLRWFKSYLDNRCQVVKNRNSSSDIFSVKSGVPQGSVLAPLSFCVI